MIADIITASRILFSLMMLVLPLHSVPFSAFYLLCGVTDVLDGFIARKLHTESKNGELFDSIADLVFAVIYCVKVLPLLPISVFILIWTAVIALVKAVVIVIQSKREHRLYIGHTVTNKLTGTAVFLLPMMISKYTVVIVCAIASFSVIEDIMCFNKKQG